MSFRAYILLDVVDGESERVAQVLRCKSGVVMVDLLEGPPDIIMVVQAPERQELAKLTTRALGSVDNMVKSMQLLPPQG